MTQPKEDRNQGVAAGTLLEALFTLANDPGRERIFITDVLAAMGHRALIVLILLFALPNAVPVPPGTSAVLGLPLLFLTVELMLGLEPWLPAAIAGWSLSREELFTLMKRLRPWLRWMEGSMQPRLSGLVHPLSVRLIGALSVLLAIILLLPIPFGNMLPAAAICILALGLLRHDGAWILAGIVAALASIVVVWEVSVPLINAGVDLLLRVLH